MYPHNQEAPFDVPENDPGSEWPEHGVVKFENYQVGVESVLRKKRLDSFAVSEILGIRVFSPP